ncbi:MAG: hypothetical protein HYY76_12610 [Acidobacteria bacterium]|nr:hypothetical protein [Acidobacteriota bacterium]
MRFKLLGIAATLAVAVVVPASAHHSHGAYQTEFLDLEGKVTEIHLMNPHSWVYIDVAGQGLWALEATFRSHLQRSGVQPGEVKPGDIVKVRCHRLRDGSRGCLLGFLWQANGKVDDWDGQGASPDEPWGRYALKR